VEKMLERRKRKGSRNKGRSKSTGKLGKADSDVKGAKGKKEKYQTREKT